MDRCSARPVTRSPPSASRRSTSSASRAWRAPLALARLGTDRLRLRGTPGLRFARLLGTGRGATAVRRRPGPQRAVRRLGRRRRARRVRGRLVRASGRRGCGRSGGEVYSVRLGLLSGHGRWGGRDVLADLRRPRAARRRRPGRRPHPRHRPPVALAPVPRVPAAGLRGAGRGRRSARGRGVGEAPVGLQATFSIWSDVAAVVAFARSPQHREVVRRTRDEDWYGEELFARFAPLGATAPGTGVIRCPADAPSSTQLRPSKTVGVGVYPPDHNPGGRGSMTTRTRTIAVARRRRCSAWYPACGGGESAAPAEQRDQGLDAGEPAGPAGGAEGARAAVHAGHRHRRRPRRLWTKTSSSQLITVVVGVRRPAGRRRARCRSPPCARWPPNELLDTDATGRSSTTSGPDTFSPRALELTRDGDTQLAVPSDGWAQLLLYRKDLLTAAGLPIPRTYADFARGGEDAQHRRRRRVRRRHRGGRRVHPADLRAPGAGQQLRAGRRRAAPSRWTARSASGVVRLLRRPDPHRLGARRAGRRHHPGHLLRRARRR